MERMNPLDAEFLYLEDGTTHMTIASCAVFEGPPPPFDELVALFASKLHLVPRYRQRVRFVPMDLGRPVWVDDPQFDLGYHVRHTALPPPGDAADLRRLMARLMSQELDRARPLWEAWVVEGVAGDRWAIVSKVHHCMVDGVAGVDLLSVVLDHERNPEPVTDGGGWRPEPGPSDLRLAADAAIDLVTSPLQPLTAAWHAVRSPRRALDRARSLATGLWSYGSALVPTPRTSLDGSIGRNRRWTWAAASLADVRTIRRALGGTVNDVVLAAVTSGLRDLALARDEDPERLGLRTLVPVSVRAEGAHGEFDNRVSAIFFDLPVRIDDSLERLAAVRGEMARLKQSHEVEAGEALTRAARAVPPTLTAQVTRLMLRLVSRLPQRTMNTVTTNVPGPQAPLYAAGRQMVEFLPFVPLGPGVRIGVAIISYNGELRFGVTGDYDTAPDIGVVADGIEAALAELLRLATTGSAATGHERRGDGAADESATAPPIRATTGRDGRRSDGDGDG
jgi:diacylglycerol O-acyltransferase